MSKIILVVDDSMMIRRIVGQIIKEAGYKVLLAENGEKAVKMASQHIPDVIVMDIEMPGIDGVEATKRIKNDQATAHIPVLFFTSLGREEDIQRAKAAGGEDFLNKPIDKENLKTAIAGLLR